MASTAEAAPAPAASEPVVVAPSASAAAHTSDPASTAGTTVANSVSPAAAAMSGGAAPPSYPLRNSALPVSSLPAHPKLAHNSTSPGMVPFLHNLLTPALQLVDSTFPKQWTGGSSKKAKPASAQVKLYKWEDPKADQTWFIRRSTHANVAERGTFTWDELDDALRVDHSEKEEAYTPDVYHRYEVCRWGPAEGLYPAMMVDGFTQIDMRVVEMAHKLPAPLLPRCFAELVVSARTADNGLLVVQVPVELRKCEAAFFSNDRNRREGSSLQKKKTTIVGTYASIERARTTSTGVIEWTMGTASDAKGALPQWLQRSQIGGAIAKDVGLVAKYLMQKRQTHSVGANATLRDA